ncbi:hypothetical protein SAMN05216257_10117 [Meinhardsimonia xiamenensis]|jgi:hypothetical protein|uniref:Uncharacterized protein n=1 Tax=Meinhardsimonia xiamenensis TaxID=990712 RepID=A0A1G8XQ65_9RHOB|nr:hypothetical protein [Meinhardsimonia xiamenensis]PRX37002.1 hypothetical protein LV81_00773 [Meinhardsimonia xiamenensis]SDJ92719.1 hypothetical protein SAMN05216257_10117 [Meinhardsimonia xiamenensis]
MRRRVEARPIMDINMLPKEVRDGLAQARKHQLKRASRYRVLAGDEVFRVLRLWSDGFSVDLQDAPHLRGLVDIYEGTRHLWQCLIVASEEADGEMVYEFKRHTAALDRAPLDFAREEDAPIALLPR